MNQLTMTALFSRHLASFHPLPTGWLSLAEQWLAVASYHKVTIANKDYILESEEISKLTTTQFLFPTTHTVPLEIATKVDN
jgi:hypothetical protein